MCAHNCERHCELCGNVAWFGMVGRKRLYERKEVMVNHQSVSQQGRYRAARAAKNCEDLAEVSK